MIVTSKRCFLNILTQLWSVDQLINANYYVGDQRAVNGIANINDRVTLNEYGQVMIDGAVESVTSFGSGYHIKIKDVLDPEPYVAQSIMGEVDQYGSSEERFIAYLNNPDTFLAVYTFLFKDPLEGNGIQILMLNDDENLLRFGHIICQYLSVNFGVDIVFIDPSYRPNCRGYVRYEGDKQTGAKTIKDIRDYGLIFDFNQAFAQSEYLHSVQNLRTYLMNFEFNDLMYLYGLLFPDDPIPPGNYTVDHIRELILYRTTSGMRTDARLPNLMLNSWQSVVDRAEQESMDFSGDDTGLY